MEKAKQFYKQNKSFVIIFAVMAVFYLQHLVSFRAGGISHDECQNANGFLLAAHGYMPYRDFEWIYGPLGLSIFGFIMRVFGAKLIVLRFSYMVFASLTIPLTYFLARRIMPYLWAGIASFLAVVLFDIPFYSYNHIFVTLGAMASLIMICRFLEAGKRVNFFWAGIFAAVALLTKPISYGFALFCSVSFFFLFKYTGHFKKRFKDYLIFAVAAAFPVVLYILYFYIQVKFKGMPVKYPFFAGDSLFLTAQSQMSLAAISVFFERFIGILPIHQLMSVSSFAGLKEVFVISFDNFISSLPFIVSIVIFLLLAITGSGRLDSKIKEKIYHDRKFLLLFAIFSVFISLEGLMVVHRYGRAFTAQVPFMLSVYILYLLRIYYVKKLVIIKTLIVLFLFYVSFLHFFRYPYSMFKKYKEPLNLNRAAGIFVTVEEKRLYESLLDYLSVNLKKEDKIVVLGYFPQFSFLTEKKNLFEDEEYIFEKVRFLSDKSTKSESSRLVLVSLEDRIIVKIQTEKPRIVLSITDNPTEDFKSLPLRLKNYIEKKYIFDKVFGPADIRGTGYCAARWVSLYKLREK